MLCKILKALRTISSGARAPVLSTEKMKRWSFSPMKTALEGSCISCEYRVHSWQREHWSAFSISIVCFRELMPNTLRGHLATKVSFCSWVSYRFTVSSSSLTIGCFLMVQVDTGDHFEWILPTPFFATMVRSSCWFLLSIMILIGSSSLPWSSW